MKSRRSMRPKTSPRLQQKLRWQYIAAGIALAAVILSIGLFLYLNLGNSRDVKAAAAVKPLIHSEGGSWTSSPSWDARVPQSGDSIIIKDGHTISIKDNIWLEGSYIGVYGTLWIDNAKKLHLSNGAKIEVFGPSGTIDSDGNGAGSKITYNGEPLWDSNMEAIVGYSVLDENGYSTVELLPVELAYFKAKGEKNKTLVEWATSAEINNDYFTIERSADGVDFEAIATIPGAGNSRTTLSYTYSDASPLMGTSYYRLRQTDYDQKYEVFKPVAVMHEQSRSSLAVQSVGPNPFKDSFTVQFELGENGPVEIKLMNMNGQIVASEKVEGYAGSNRYEFRDEQGLIKGTYILSLVQQQLSSKGIRLIKQ